MGNCCGGEEAASQPAKKAFRGEGHRLGTANEATPLATPNVEGGKSGDQLPEPRHDPNLTSDDRDDQRNARLAAAEARMKKAGGSPKRKKEYKNVPLTGPNSKPTMTWTAG